jgi:hypothetical protein
MDKPKTDSPSSPAVGSPFLAGTQAFREGVVVGDNPYPENADEHWQWMHGWMAAGLKARWANTSGERPLPAGEKQ